MEDLDLEVSEPTESARCSARKPQRPLRHFLHGSNHAMSDITSSTFCLGPICSRLVQYLVPHHYCLPSYLLSSYSAIVAAT